MPSPGPFVLGSSSAPTWSHLDMARPPHEDPEYRKSLGLSRPIAIPGGGAPFGGHCATSASPLNLSSPKSNKFMRLNCNGKGQVVMGGSSSLGSSHGASLLVTPPGKAGAAARGGRSRGEARKCRKVYGMDSRDLWCTQCKWKKACTRFSE